MRLPINSIAPNILKKPREKRHEQVDDSGIGNGGDGISVDLLSTQHLYNGNYGVWSSGALVRRNLSDGALSGRSIERLTVS